MRVQEVLQQFGDEWRKRLGSTGDDLARDLTLLADAILAENELAIEEVVRKRVASWALADSDEKIPLNKISKEGLVQLLTNPEYISDGELLEILKARGFHVT